MKYLPSYFFVAGALLLSCFRGSGQALQVGDTLPSLTVGSMLNYPGDSLKLRALKGKLLIFDFWSTGCRSCIQAFPKMDSLQRTFGDRLQVILVNGESRDSTLRFFAKHKKIPMPGLPMVTGDTLLQQLFPHIYVPHHVWVDGTGRVRFITDGHNATAENIGQFLDKGALALREKKYREQYVVSSLLELPKAERDAATEHYALVARCISGVSIGHALHRSGPTEPANRITMNCASIVQLFTAAFFGEKGLDYWPRNALILEVSDPFSYELQEGSNRTDEWQASHSYNYELRVPTGDSSRLFQVMQEHLMAYFGIEASVERRKVKCLVLLKRGQKDKLRSKGGEAESNFWVESSDSVRYLKNQPFDMLTTKLAFLATGKGLATPFIDATGYRGPIDMTLPREALDSLDIALLNRELQRYHLELVEKKWETTVLILKERKNKSLN